MVCTVVEGTKIASRWFMQHRAWASSTRLFKAVVCATLVGVAILIAVFETAIPRIGCEQAFELLDNVYLVFEGMRVLVVL